MISPLRCLAALSVLLPALLVAETPPATTSVDVPGVGRLTGAGGRPLSRAEVMGVAHLPMVQVRVTIYKVKGEMIDRLKPYDMEGLLDLVAETRARHEPSVVRNLGGGVAFWGQPDTDGARLLSAPMMVVRAGKINAKDGSHMSVGAPIFLDSQGVKQDPKMYTGEDPLREYFSGVEFSAQSWQDASSGDLVAEVHATVSTIEDFIDIQVEQPDGSSVPMRIPVLDTTVCEGVIPLKDGETKVFVWRENFTEKGKSLIIATVTANILPNGR
ncbi:MAG: hypothetical protein ACQKBW_13240 [Puniceicoccales bacterium]